MAEVLTTSYGSLACVSNITAASGAGATRHRRTGGEVICRSLALLRRVWPDPYPGIARMRSVVGGSASYPKTAVTASAAILTDVVELTIVPWTIAQTFSSSA